MTDQDPATTTGPAVALTTIVVNWNTVGLLDDCLGSIEAATPAGLRHQVVVVDNASTDGSVAHLQRHWPQVEVIENAENEGFCRANNTAIRATSAPLLLLVNTDARLAPDSIATLLGYLESDPQAAVVGPRLVYGDGRFQRWTAGRLPTLASLATFFLGLDGRRPWTRRGLYLGADVADAFRPDWVSSAVMAVRRSALEEIGLLDESIFVYMDDVDLCARATAAGWHVWYAADTTATHFMGASSVRDDGKVSPAALRALNRWYGRRAGRPAAYALRGLELIGFGLRVLATLPGSLRGSSTARARRRVHATHFRLALEPLDV